MFRTCFENFASLVRPGGLFIIDHRQGQHGVHIPRKQCCGSGEIGSDADPDPTFLIISDLDPDMNPDPISAHV
jgi:hypothetical protein